jgi:hypothetical protein
MEEHSKLSLNPLWNFTSELWINCSKCDFVFLIPLVAMIGKKKDAPKYIRFVEPKGLFAVVKSLFQPKKDSGERIFGFMWPISKFCKKCKVAYISKLGKSIKLKYGYWKEINQESDAEFVEYLKWHTINFNVSKKEKCVCGEQLIPLVRCPKCNSPFKISRRNISGFPLLREVSKP